MFRRKNKTAEKNVISTFETREKEMGKLLDNRSTMKDVKKEMGCYLSSYEYIPMAFNKEITLKMCIVGNYGVGKTAIVENYTKGTFSPEYRVSIGADFSNKIIKYNDSTKINLQLWDVGGNEIYGYYTSVYYRYAVGAIVVYDLTRYNTFESAQKWIEDVRERSILPGGKDIPIILLGNKADIVTVDFFGNKQEFCRKNNLLDIIYVSAKNGVNIHMAMNRLIEEMLKNHREPDDRIVHLAKKPHASKIKGCCFN